MDRSSADFQLVDSPFAPFAVEPDVSATLTVRYTPSDVGGDVGRLAITTDVVGLEVLEVGLIGRGVEHEVPGCGVQARIAGAEDWGLFPDEDGPLEALPLQTVELEGDP